jgi:hypothetical protein
VGRPYSVLQGRLEPFARGGEAAQDVDRPVEDAGDAKDPFGLLGKQPPALLAPVERAQGNPRR